MLLAFVIFLLIKCVMRARKHLEELVRIKEEEEKKIAPPPAPPENVLLLREIRDLLKETQLKKES